MGLSIQDQSKVPTSMTERECYIRIFDWHKKNGAQKLQSVYNGNEAYSRAYLALVRSMPHPNKATSADRDFIFGEVIYMLMEWSYHQVDENGIKIAAYAHHAIDLKYNKFIHDDKFRSNRKLSSLYPRFDHENWKSEFEEKIE